MTKCKNLRLADTCATCRYAKRLYCGTEGYLRHCLIDDDEPPDPSVFPYDCHKQHVAEKVWDEWSEAHKRYDTDVCDAHKNRSIKPLYCFGVDFGTIPRCPVCAYYVECQQASRPRKSPPVYDPYGE